MGQTTSHTRGPVKCSGIKRNLGTRRGWYRMRYRTLENCAILANLASRKAFLRNDVASAGRVSKLDVEGSNPFARSEVVHS
jgi:hypothetical protein